MFEDLLKKAIFGKKSDPLEDLIEKAKPKGSFKPTANGKVGALANAAPKNASGSVQGMANSTGSPSAAGEKTNHVLNSGAVPKQTQVTDGNGGHTKTVFTGGSTVTPKAPGIGGSTATGNLAALQQTAAKFDGAQHESVGQTASPNTPKPPKVTAAPPSQPQEAPAPVKQPSATEAPKTEAPKVAPKAQPKLHPKIKEDWELEDYANRFANGATNGFDPEAVDFLSKMKEHDPATKKVWDAWADKNEELHGTPHYDNTSTEHQAMVDQLHKLTGTTPEQVQVNRAVYQKNKAYSDQLSDYMQELEKEFGKKPSVQKLAEKYWDETEPAGMAKLGKEVKKLYASMFGVPEHTLAKDPMQELAEQGGVQEPEQQPYNPNVGWMNHPGYAKSPELLEAAKQIREGKYPSNLGGKAKGKWAAIKFLEEMAQHDPQAQVVFDQFHKQYNDWKKNHKQGDEFTISPDTWDKIFKLAGTDEKNFREVREAAKQGTTPAPTPTPTPAATTAPQTSNKPPKVTGAPATPQFDTNPGYQIGDKIKLKNGEVGEVDSVSGNSDKWQYVVTLPDGSHRVISNDPSDEDVAEKMSKFIDTDETMRAVARDVQSGKPLEIGDAEGVIETLAREGDFNAKKLLKEYGKDEESIELQHKIMAMAYTALGAEAPAPQNIPQGKVAEPILTVPASEQPKPVTPQLPGDTKPTEHQQQLAGTHLVQHPSGGFVAAGHPLGTLSMMPVLDHAGKFYHDNVNVGDVVGYRAHTATHGLMPFESKVVDKNPNGHTILHVEHPSKAKREAGEPLPVHYNLLTHAWTSNPENPHEQKRLQYAGEHVTPSQSTGVDEAKPQKHLSHAELQKEEERHNELMKLRMETAKKHIKEGDFVEFWGDNNGEPILIRGKVTKFPTLGETKEGVEAGVKGKKAQEAANFVMVQPYGGAAGVKVPLNYVERFGKHQVGKYYYYKFKDHKGDWDDENQIYDEGQHQDMLEHGKPSLPSANPDLKGKVISAENGAQGEMGETPEIKDGVSNPVEHEQLKHLDPKSPEYRMYKTALDAGMQPHGVDEENDLFHFFDPKKKQMHSIPLDDVTPERIDEIINAKATEQQHLKDGFAPKPQVNPVESHWTHVLPKETVSEVRGALDKLDKKRETEHVPAHVLAARHELLHQGNHVGALSALATINNYLNGKGGTPKNAQAKTQKHLDEVTAYIHSQGLDNPYITKKIQQLSGLLKHDPNSPLVDSLSNQIHTYAYEQGERHPVQMLKNIADMAAKKIGGTSVPPEEVAKNIEQYRDMAIEGAVKPEQALKEAMDYLEQIGIDTQKNVIPNLPNAGATGTRSDAEKARLDSYIQLRDVSEGLNQTGKTIQAHTDSLAPKAPELGEQEQEEATIPGTNMSPEQAKKMQMEVSKVGHDLESADEWLATLIDAEKANELNEWGGRVALDNAIQKVKDIQQQYQQMVSAANNVGIQMPVYTPKSLGFIADTDEAASEHLHEAHNKHENWNRMWMANQISHARNSINVTRSHFMARAGRNNSAVQNEMRGLDSMIQQMLDNNSWSPIDWHQFKHPLVQSFAAAVNEYIQDVRDREQLVKVPINQALKMHEQMHMGKSLAETIAAEKVIARRDISLALRKSFYNDKQSPELRKATDLMASYFDDYIDAVMNNYTNIPLAVRKSIARKLLKSLINDVIKDNVFSATTMNEDFTAPLTTDVIKSMGREVAAAVTAFRMDTCNDREFLVVDLNKGIGSEPIRTPRKVESFETVHKKEIHGLRFSQDGWFSLLRGLEADMYKANMIETRVSENRIRKFVADNDQKTLESFYNSNVQQLNERLAEIKKWAY